MASLNGLSKHTRRAERIKIREEHDILSPEEEELKRQEGELKIVQDLRSSNEWYEAISHGHLSDSARTHSLTAHSLRGPHKILRRPLKFFNEYKTECIVILYLGDHLCGMNGNIHNGLLSTLLDEHLAFVTLPNLPNSTGFTANLNVEYKEFVQANQWIVVHGILDRVEGRKAYANAWIETIDGTKTTEATALYISPRNPK